MNLQTTSLFSRKLKNYFFYFQFLKEALIIVILLFVHNNYLHKEIIQKNQAFIESDGRCYYEYLPAFFIYKDLHFTYIDTLQTDYYDIERVKPIYRYLENGQRINKYFVGTAILQTPFFLTAHFIASKENSKYAADGFSYPYQRAIWVANVFYLFCGLVCIRLFLKTYQINSWWIFFTQLSLLFATPLLHYTIYEIGFSHVYSFFLISWFTYIVRRYFLTDNARYLILALVIFGLITIVRPVNVLILAFTPLLVDSIGEFLNKIKILFQKHFISLLIGIVLFTLILSLQFYFSYAQTGNSLSYNYGEERFYFLDPNIFKFLFSYHKGFFLWTPWWFVIFILGFVYWIYLKKNYHAIVFFMAFFVLVYVFSSWYAWSYACSLGQRPMVDFYGILVVLVIPIFKQKNQFVKWSLLPISIILIVVMQIQTYQYQMAILMWDNTTKEWYWKVFLSTNTKYSWYYDRHLLPVGEKCSEEILSNSPKLIKPQNHQEFFSHAIKLSDTLATIGEIKFEIDREADREFLDITLKDSLDNVLFIDYFNFYTFQYGNKVICRFYFPKEKTETLKIWIHRVYESFTINSVTFSTYQSVD